MNDEHPASQYFFRCHCQWNKALRSAKYTVQNVSNQKWHPLHILKASVSFLRWQICCFRGGTSGITPKRWPLFSQHLFYHILSFLALWSSWFFWLKATGSCHDNTACSSAWLSQRNDCALPLYGIPDWHSNLLQVGCECHARLLTTRTWG